MLAAASSIQGREVGLCIHTHPWVNITCKFALNVKFYIEKFCVVLVSKNISDVKFGTNKEMIHTHVGTYQLGWFHVKCVN